MTALEETMEARRWEAWRVESFSKVTRYAQGPEPTPSEWAALGLDPELQAWAAERWPDDSWTEQDGAVLRRDAEALRRAQVEAGALARDSERQRVASLIRAHHEAHPPLDDDAVLRLLMEAFPDILERLMKMAGDRARRTESSKRQARRLRAREAA